MAEGFLHQVGPSKLTQERLGYKCFDELLSMSFFQQSPNDVSMFVMHDLMNDLATFIAGDFFFKLEKKMEKDDRIKDLEKLRHMSFVCEEFEAYKKFEVFQRARGLRTFLFVEVKERWERYFLSNKVLVDLLPQLPVIRVISLSGYEISEVPESFGSLKHLCFSKLKNLRHMNIRGTSRLKDMTLGIDLNNLRGEISFKGLDKMLNTMEAREASLSQKRITVLKVEWDDGSREQIAGNKVLDALKPYDDCLKKLVIVNYLGLEFPKYVRDPSFRQLARVSIRGCRECASLPPLGQLQSLKELSVEDMGDIKVVGSEFFGTGLAFPLLESLSFLNISGWELWSTNSKSGVEDSVFPCLQELNIKGCPNLVEFSLKAPLLSLRDLRVDECGDGVLRSLVHAAPSVTKMEIDSISGLTNYVWRGVILDLKVVEILKIMQCNEIRYLWESKEAEASSKVLVHLRNLRVTNCKNLVSLGEKDEEEHNYERNLLTFQRSLEVSSCDNFKHLSFPNNIKTLILFGCKSITCVSFSSKVKSVSILLLLLFPSITYQVLLRPKASHYTFSQCIPHVF
nr:hypothetical protein [Tanacetum cinerariifolium]